MECKFGEATRTEGLSDRLVLGIRDPKMITDFLKVKLADLTFELAVQKCLAIEQANKDIQVLQGEQGPDTLVNKLDTAQPREGRAPPKFPQKTQSSRGKDTKPPKPRYHCTGSQKCPFIKECCFHCGIIGHTERACKKKQATQEVADAGVNVMEGADSEESDGDMGNFTM